MSSSNTELANAAAAAAATAATAARSSANSATTAASSASSASSAAAASSTAATASAAAANTSATSAATAAAAALASRDALETSLNATLTAAVSSASTYASTATTQRGTASTQSDTATTQSSTATTAKNSAEASAATAATNATTAATNLTTAQAAQATAENSSTSYADAVTAANSAATARDAAQTAATSAATAATAAGTQPSVASTAATAAATAATAASTAATAAQTAATAAASAASTAATAAANLGNTTEANASAASAASSATSAQTAADEAAAFADAASAAATAASTAATDTSTASTAASASSTAAAASASAAATAATAAQAAADAKLPSYRAVGSALTGGRLWTATRFGDVFYFAGQFKETYSGESRPYVAAYDSSGSGSWSTLGGAYFGGASDEITQVCVDGSGNVYVVGSFATVYLSNTSTTITTNCLARYDLASNTWAGYGTGLNSGAYGRGVAADGTYVYVMGSSMTSINGTSVSNVARITLGTPSSATVSACNGGTGSTIANATLYNFDGTIFAAGAGVNQLSGTTWSDAGSGSNGPGSSTVLSVDRDSSGNMICGGSSTVWYYTASTTTWTNLAPASGEFYCVGLGPDGTRYTASTGANNVRTWTSGTTWSTLVSTNSYVKTIQFYNGRIYFGGNFTTFNGTAALLVAAYY